MADETVYGFGFDDSEAILRIISGGGDSSGRSRERADEQPIVMAVATSGVPARSGTTMGSATVAVKYLAYSGSNRIITDAGYTVTALNLAASAVASGAYVLLVRMGDAFIVVWEECVE
jgi:hypothetical protein